MGNIKHYFRVVITFPPKIVIKKILNQVKKKVTLTFVYICDHWRSTYAKSDSVPKGNIFCYFPTISIDTLRFQTSQIKALTENYLNHRFDLLGSGWVQVKHGIHCPGLENYRYNMGNPVQIDIEGRWLEGRINNANLSESKQIWQLIFRNPLNTQNSEYKANYVPIDWQLDFKSGYRWSEATWYQHIPIGHRLGVDIKVPWELARMQHLSQFAFAYKLAKIGITGFHNPQVYITEYRNEILDFIANNPPRFGVNWRCTMDVATRVTNWLITYDLFKTSGAEFDEEFEEVFVRSVYEHGKHIIANLEWSQEWRGNHYLSHIVGLLFVAFYLPCSSETNAWLAFSVRELIKEVEKQFNADGTNFEGSTCYHRLSAEMVIYATATVLGLPEEKINALKDYDHTLIKTKPGLTPPPLPFYQLTIANSSELKFPDSEMSSLFPSWYFERIEKMAEFTMHITKPNGHIPQIGDNDSGRFLKLHPVYNLTNTVGAKAVYANLKDYNDLPDDADYWDEDHLDHRHLVAAINGLFGRMDFGNFAGQGFLETQIIKTLARGVCLQSYRKVTEPSAAERLRIRTVESLDQMKKELTEPANNKSRETVIPILGGDIRQGPKLFAYPDFGVYIYRSQRLYLLVRFGPQTKEGNPPHAHNDQLSIVLSIDGNDWIADPGTYLYTPIPDRRNEYRSRNAHFVPFLDYSQPTPEFVQCLFGFNKAAQGKCDYCDVDGFIGHLTVDKFKIYRLLSIDDTSITIIDSNSAQVSPLEGKCYRVIISPQNSPIILNSPGYGKRKYHKG